MKAVLIYGYGDAGQLRYEDTAVPEYGGDEVLVKIHATSINPIDWKIRSGSVRDHMPVQFPLILGRDLSGEVVESGRSVKGFPKGMRVMAMADGTYAEYTVAKAEVLVPIPDSLDFEQAAALPLMTTTGAQLIERAVKPKAGQTILVTGALGSVGRTAVHVAKKHGAHVLAGVRAKEKDAAAELGADQVIAIDSDEEIGRLHDLDAIADTVGGVTIQRLLKTIRKGGVLGSVLGSPEGAKKFKIRVESFMAQPDASRLHQLADDVGRHEFSVPIARRMKLEQIQEAQSLAERGGITGKIIVTP